MIIYVSVFYEKTAVPWMSVRSTHTSNAHAWCTVFVCNLKSIGLRWLPDVRLLISYLIPPFRAWRSPRRLDSLWRDTYTNTSRSPATGLTRVLYTYIKIPSRYRFRLFLLLLFSFSFFFVPILFAFAAVSGVSHARVLFNNTASCA